jgi:hypothetical protein
MFGNGVGAGDEPVVFMRAFHDEWNKGNERSDRVISFDPNINIDWERLAPGYLRDVEAKELISMASREWFDHVEVDFDLDLDPRFGEGQYYLISPAGISPLGLLSMRGSALYVLSSNHDEILRRSFHGVVMAMLLSSPGEVAGGFVVFGEPVLDTIIRELDETSKASKHRMVSSGAAGAGAAPNNSPVRWAFLFSLNGEEKYEFSQLEPDVECAVGCCEFRYLIRRAGDPGSILATNSYGCDI